MDETDVAIIGAGIAGSAAAIALARRGWQTVLIDRQQFPRHKVCGEFLSPESLAMLEELTLLDEILDQTPARIRQASLALHGQRELQLALPGTALGISRFFLDSALHRRAADHGALIRTGVTASEVRQEGSRYVVELLGAAKSRIYARAVIVASGAYARSGLPGTSVRGEATKRDRKRYFGIKSHLKGMATGETVELYFWKGGYVGISPVEGGVMNAAGLLVHGEQAGAKGVLELLEHASRSNRQLQRRLEGAEPIPGTQAAVSPVLLGKRSSVWDGVALAGDAASVIPPLCGDGMSMALRSAALCAEQADAYLAGRIDLLDWQRAYSSAIRQQLARPQRWGRILQWSLSQSALTPFFRQAALAAPFLAHRLVTATRLAPMPVGSGSSG
ncbi:NAD(P)/FAD-dependent oxidoreductase [Paenibacillus daejeonensis]|uniref:NAD(P)/FAD-dependent oxidoreductase n=1 Tax=Paenibacillus daejeonensis TaxID=135193 RepID=UPI0003602C5A|nr:FAD-dependent oxidoreductase [Paenibacillus daejeonensis]